MRLLILGATGLTGQQLVIQALQASHHVTALVRTPSKLNLSHKNLTILTGDVLDQTTLSKALADTDAVLSALGKGKSLKSHELMTKSVSNIISCMESVKTDRLIMLSAFGVGESFPQANFIQKIIFRTFLKDLFADKAKADNILKHSSLDWTLVYPVVLTDGPLTVDYQVGETLPMKGMPKITRSNVAHFMLQQLTDNAYHKKTAILMS